MTEKFQSLIQLLARMDLKCTLLVVFSLIFVTFAAVVEIEDGKISGTKRNSRRGVSYYAFLGIPYAQPPVNGLRFQPPQPVKPWTRTLNASVYGPLCMQGKLGKQVASEDCLQLNVFTKSLKNTKLKPTIVFIHGGGFESGSGVNVDPVIMMDRDIVFVSINYRLGAFGFLATGTKDAYGNMGLKDQTLALKWIKKNIEKFGGDSNRITISGSSAGAHSVSAQILSPMAKDLFHRGIMFSGGISWKPKIPDDYLEVSMKLAGKLSCTVDDVSAMVECLKKVRSEFVTVIVIITADFRFLRRASLLFS
jgi:carboxylesterase type B